MFPNAGSVNTTIRTNYRILIFYDRTKDTIYSARFIPETNTLLTGTPINITFTNNHIRLYAGIGWSIPYDPSIGENDANFTVTYYRDFYNPQIKKWLQSIILTH